MKISFYHRAIVLLVLLISAILSSCRCHVEDPQPLASNYMNVAEGDTAIVENLNIAGMGARKNKLNTTWIIKGHVVMDHLQIQGNVIVEQDSRLTVLGTLTIQEEGKVLVKHELNYAELRQSGEIIYKTSED